MLRADFTIGWICAHPYEIAASKAILDYEHERPADVPDVNDGSIMVWGRIGDHNVIMACPPPGICIKPSASTAVHLLRSHPSLRFCLLVGVGSGIPSAQHNIRLGDVVVSKSTETSGGLIQYDIGKTTAGSKPVVYSHLLRPPSVVLKTVQALESHHDLVELAGSLEGMFQRFPQMREEYSRPDAEDYSLPMADVEKNQIEGEEYKPTQMLYHERRKGDQIPQVHYGFIASGNKVITSSEERERLSIDNDVVCYEMEATGITEGFPCIVIRGISDYADGRQHDGWQKYAAATAAAYVHQLLNAMPSSGVEQVSFAKDVVGMWDPTTLRGTWKLEDAKKADINVLHKLHYPYQKTKFFNHLHKLRPQIDATIAHHLGLRRGSCQISNVREWIHGSFNVCIPVVIDKQSKRRIMFRCPLPYRVGEAFRPGNADEKLRCEAGTYAWLQQNCPSIPIPRLYGLGLSTGQMFTTLDRLPFLSRCFHSFRRWVVTWLGRPPSSQYVRHQRQDTALNELGTGYLLLEYIEDKDGEMLSETWKTKGEDEHLRTNLYQGLSRIFLALARVRLPRIGALRMDNDGQVTVANRPLSTDIVMMENEGIPIDIPRDMTYSSADTFLLDLLATHDARIIHQPNGASSVADLLYQTSTLSSARAIFFQMLRTDLRRGPFILSFDDLHQSNIFVDAEWNITKILDLEFASAHPIQSVHPPYWLVAEAIDGIDEDKYKKERTKFLEILRKEEAILDAGDFLSCMMEQGWKSGAFWVYRAAMTVSGFSHLFNKHIVRFLGITDEDQESPTATLYKLWRPDASRVLLAKIRDKKEYDRQLDEIFSE